MESSDKSGNAISTVIVQDSAIATPASWWPSWLRWKPTSAVELKDAETQMLSIVENKYEKFFVKAGEFHINTLKMGEGPPLVLLHGFGAGIGFWVKNLDELSKHHTVYAIDLPGFGRSSRVAFTGKTPVEAEKYFVDAIEEWRKSMQIESKFCLLGHSFGGYLAASYSLTHSDKISHLILADPWGVPQRDPEWIQRIPKRWQIVGSFLTRFNPLVGIRALGPLGPSIIERIRGDISRKFENILPSTSIVNKYIYHMNAQDPTGETAFWHMMDLFWAKQPLFTRLPDLTPDIKVTMLYGSNTWMSKDIGLDLAQKMGDRASYTLIENSGHHIYIDNYHQFNAQVLQKNK